MNLHTLMFTNSDCYKKNADVKAGRVKDSRYSNWLKTRKGVMVHSTGCNNPNLRRYVGPDDGLLGVNANGNHWNKPGVECCLHGWVGLLKDGSVASYQCLPFDFRGIHADGTTNKGANDQYIAFEICDDKTYKDGKLTAWGSKDYFTKAYQEAVEFTAYICKECGFDPLGKNVIISHHEGYKLGIASSHTDPTDWFAHYGKSMDAFRADVKTAMSATALPATGPAAVDWLADKGIITSPAYWKEQLPKVKYLGDMFIKWSVSLPAKSLNADRAFTGAQAIDFLYAKGLITSPEYWKEKINEVKYLGDMFVKWAKST